METGAMIEGVLGPEEREIVAMVRRLSQERVAPRAMAIDADNEFPHDVYAQFHELGLTGLLVAEEHGGAGASVVAMAHVYAEIARASATCAMLLSNTVEAFATMTHYAEPELRGAVIQRVLEQGEIPCFALTEPGAG